MKKTIFYFAIIVFLTACYPGGPEYYEELDIVLSEYDQEFDFMSKQTFAMPDQVVKISGNIGEGESPDFIQEPYNSQILQRIEINLTGLGWEKVEDPSTADVVLFPASWTNTTVYYWYDYWCWYYYYYCGWGWYWYPTVSVSSYTTGTLVMTMVVDGDEYIDPARVWTGAINGLLSGVQSTSRLNKGIDQAFIQSPYLDIN
jgi:hypothetical protein